VGRFLSRTLLYGASFSTGLELGEWLRRRVLERRRRRAAYREELSDRAAALVLELAALDAELRGLVEQP
jgi:hypothetical protein